jgi:lipid-A-disaccharide synthase-like uncharacterized protein
MIAHLSSLTDWLYTVFVVKFDRWTALGFVAQFAFTMRFLVQWAASEKAGKSVIPVAFWFFSIGGGLLLLIYAIEQQDPVFIAGQALGILIYLRNLMLIFKPKSGAAKAE